MSHDTHQHHGHTQEGKPKTAFSASFWLVIIIAGLFIAALNFIQAESSHEGNESEERAEHGKLLMQEGAGHTGKKARIEQKEMSTHQYETTDSAAHESHEAAH